MNFIQSNKNGNILVINGNDSKGRRRDSKNNSIWIYKHFFTHWIPYVCVCVWMTMNVCVRLFAAWYGFTECEHKKQLYFIIENFFFLNRKRKQAFFIWNVKEQREKTTANNYCFCFFFFVHSTRLTMYRVSQCVHCSFYFGWAHSRHIFIHTYAHIWTLFMNVV